MHNEATEGLGHTGVPQCTSKCHRPMGNVIRREKRFGHYFTLAETAGNVSFRSLILW